MVLPHEGAHDADARQSLPADKRNAVEGRLHPHEIGDAAGHDYPKDHADQRGRNEEDESEPDVDEKSGDHRTHGEQRPTDELAHAEGNGDLDLVDVVGDARDERGRAETVELGGGEFVDVRVERAANFGTDTLRAKRRHLLAHEGEGEADDSHANKRDAAKDNGVDVAGNDAPVDHPRDDEGREQVEEHLDKLAERPQHEIAHVGTGESLEEIEHSE